MYQKPYKIMIFCLLIVSICISGYSFKRAFWDYQKGKTTYEEVKEIAIIEPIIESESSAEQTESPQKINFSTLQEINPDIVAWIQFEEPAQINYPVVQGIDNQEYLKTTFTKEQNPVGSIFMDKKNSSDFSDRNTIIYGHNMKNGTMFGRLKEYKSQSFYKQYPYFYIHMPDGRSITYQIFAVSVVDAKAQNYLTEFQSDKEFDGYIKHITDTSLYSADIDVTNESQIVSLSTCTNVDQDERLVIHAVKVEENH